MCQYYAVDGAVTDWHFTHHGRFALGGLGAAMVEATGVTPEGRTTHACTGIYADEHIPVREGWPTPRAMTAADIDRTVLDFQLGAKRALAAGFDFVELHGAHGYLL